MYTEKDKNKDITDPVVVHILPANGSTDDAVENGTTVKNGAATTPIDAEPGAEKSDENEKEKKEEEDKETRPPVGVISIVSILQYNA